MRILIILTATVLVLGSCGTMKKASSSTTPENPRRRNSSTQFIDNISLNPGNKHSEVAVAPPPANNSSINKYVLENSPEIERISAMQIKYAILMNAPVEELSNARLILFIDNWYGTRYLYGGTDHSGVDCSAFVQSFMDSIYSLSVPRTAKEQYFQSNHIKKKELSEGDLVFFHTKKGKAITHVGVYLRNSKFIHASSSGGVMISDLNEPYYKKRYVTSGRYRTD